MTLLIRMQARDSHEEYRSASILELFFDLVVVVLIGLCAEIMSNMIEHDRLNDALKNFPIVFFIIWWVWINFTWFSSAFDNDDWLYRTVSLVQMLGMLLMAKGIQPGLEKLNLTIILLGYIVMRMALCFQWIRVHFSDKEYHGIALRYAFVSVFVQIAWIFYLLAPNTWHYIASLCGIICEILIPTLIERNGKIPFHPHHLLERYGLFSLIVLGESLMSITKTLLNNEYFRSSEYIIVSIASFTIVAGLWWIYFSAHRTEKNSSLNENYIFAAGHFFIVLSATLIATGIDIAINDKTLKVHHTYIGIGLINISVVVFILSCLIVKMHRYLSRSRKRSVLVVIVAIIVMTYIPLSTVAYMCILAGLIIIAVIIVEPMRINGLKNKSALFMKIPDSC